MIWILTLLLLSFPNLADYNDPKDVAKYVMKSGEFGKANEIILRAKGEIRR